jgi:transketolase C-terminal domain/subunit
MNQAYRFAYEEALLALAQMDDKIVFVDSYFGRGTGYEPFWQRFPDRYIINCAIAEQGMVSVACGLAACGLRCSRVRSRS